MISLSGTTVHTGTKTTVFVCDVPELWNHEELALEIFVIAHAIDVRGH